MYRLYGYVWLCVAVSVCIVSMCIISMCVVCVVYRLCCVCVAVCVCSVCVYGCVCGCVCVAYHSNFRAARASSSCAHRGPITSVAAYKSLSLSLSLSLSSVSPLSLGVF